MRWGDIKWFKKIQRGLRRGTVYERKDTGTSCIFECVRCTAGECHVLNLN